MLQFKVSGMTCGGCVASITRAIRLEYPSATVAVDLPGQIVKVDGVEDATNVARLIDGAGYQVLEQTTLSV